jgi:PAS domain S-box-containing protein
MVKLMGAERAEELLGQHFLDRISSEYHEVIRARIQTQLETGVPAPPMEQKFLRLDGTPIPVETTAVAIRFEGEDGHLVFVRDITRRREAEKERMNLEAQLQQAQKMESVGRLAGGVAHDFNNLLMAIMGYTELSRNVLGSNHRVSPYLDEILNAAERSAGITRQLLAFARKQAIAPVLIDLNEHVEATLKLLRRLVGEEIELAWKPRAQDARVKMDPSQVDQILANLAVNARDAIAGVGKLNVETGNVTFDAAYCAEHEGATPGNYVMLAVTDSGCGMDQETLDHIFEPFFTTKPAGKGTGLGLATIYGIVKQNEGYIDVCSEPDSGTTFRIYLPHHDQDSDEAKDAAGSQALPGGSETILLVEDEQSVRQATALLLQSFGYNVLSAPTPDDALRQAADHPGAIHLLITDVIMPGMNGRDLAIKLTEMQPGMACLYVSGYTADVIAHHGILDEGIHFLPKPFAREALANKVHEVLRGRRGTEKH